MGAQLSLLSPTAQTIAISAYIDNLSDVQYSKPLSSARFLKTIKCLDKHGAVVVKLLIKPTTELDLSLWVKELEDMRVKLLDLPNVLPFESIIDSQRAGYLIRPHIRYNLYDRISIRPFLEPIERKWIVYQILVALSKIHQQNVYHGDLKTENVLMTSWNWCVISDFAVFKPVYLPENNPSQFSFYFDTSQRHICYVAPERFLANDQEVEDHPDAQLTWQMDIFSLGCAIAEIYLEGLPIFTLPQLFKYKKGEYQPNLDAIEDINVRRLIQSMIALDPAQRLCAQDCLTQFRRSVFPDHFYTFLHPYVRKLSEKPTASDPFLDCDSRISRIYNDFDKIALYLGFKHQFDNETTESSDTLIPVHLQLPGMIDHTPRSTHEVFKTPNDCASLILLDIILHSVRNSTHSSFRMQACDLILAFAEQLHDEAKLDRCLPYLVYMLDDPSEDVQSAALRSLTQLLVMVDVITPVNVYIFPEYILPKLQQVLKRTYTESDIPGYGRHVRSVFAGCLPYLAQTARKFYDMSSLFRTQLQHASGDEFVIENDDQLESAFRNVVAEFESLVVQILTDQDSFVRISLLKNILPLAAFFGKDRTNDVILSHLITYLNDKNPNIRLEFISSIVSVSVFVGIVSLEQYILPLLVQSLTDSDELVVIGVLKTFTELCGLGLVRKIHYWDLIRLTIRLILHPNETIRQSVLDLVVAIGSSLSLVDLYCMLYPIIRPFFQDELTEFTWESLYISAHKPISPAVYTLAQNWSLKQDSSLFWQRVEASHRRGDLFNTSEIAFMRKNASQNTMHRFHGVDDMTVVSNSEVPLSQQDMQQVEKLKSVGMADSEIWKVATLRSYIFKIARSNSRKTRDTDVSKPNVLPRTVFFDVSYKSEVVRAPQTDSAPKRASVFLYGAVRPDTLSNGSKATEEPPSSRDSVQKITTKIKHSYTGTNPYIWKFLNGMTFEPTLDDYIEFGSKTDVYEVSETSEMEPNGVLISRLVEHKAAISGLEVSSDQRFFVTADRSGELKLWDSARLETNVTGSSSLSLNLESSIVCTAFMKDRNCIATATKDGYVKVFRIDFTPAHKKQASTRISLIRHYKLEPADSYALQLCFCSLSDKPLLVCTTPTAKIIGLDVRTMTVVFSLQNNLSHGIPTSLAVDETQGWAVVGTSKGILDLWDLGFGISLKSTKFRGSSFPINRVQVLPDEFVHNGKKSRYIAVVGGSGDEDVTIWDVARLQPRQVLCCSSATSTLETYVVTELSNESDAINDELMQLELSEDVIVADGSCSALRAVGTLAVSASASGKLVVWDLADPERSRVVGSKTASFVATQINSNLLFVSERYTDGSRSSPLADHRDRVLHVGLLRRPYQMVISTDRTGVINVYR
ncbi:hypothetical protein OGAPHI_002014 [Ogataea philodendri]|uniref:non-specific serine/threonine protein kinase n=1 Tax=Ogataea philodendri TaxID=1378263 RepID=A0A9P8PB02_9ASCO|nr:uncharacterized protein OGAPHI_002014 [Ogataea philodendri]KAH3668260.1 hypothetical protein OGAPHI_002014 [Ogataea philodendri]